MYLHLVFEENIIPGDGQLCQLSPFSGLLFLCAAVAFQIDFEFVSRFDELASLLIHRSLHIIIFGLVDSR